MSFHLAHYCSDSEGSPICRNQLGEYNGDVLGSVGDWGGSRSDNQLMSESGRCTR